MFSDISMRQRFDCRCVKLGRGTGQPWNRSLISSGSKQTCQQLMPRRRDLLSSHRPAMQSVSLPVPQGTRNRPTAGGQRLKMQPLSLPSLQVLSQAPTRDGPRSYLEMPDMLSRMLGLLMRFVLPWPPFTRPMSGSRPSGHCQLLSVCNAGTLVQGSTASRSFAGCPPDCLPQLS